MTMTRVVSNYLRWFKLNRLKGALRGKADLSEHSGSFVHAMQQGDASPDWRVDASAAAERSYALDDCLIVESAGPFLSVEDFVDPFVWGQSKASNDHSNGEGKHPTPEPKVKHD